MRRESRRELTNWVRTPSLWMKKGRNIEEKATEEIDVLKRKQREGSKTSVTDIKNTV